MMLFRRDANQLPPSLSEAVKESISETVREAFSEFLSETWAFIREDLISTSYTLVLVGGTICVVLYVAGWEKGLRYLGIMFVVHILLRAVLA